MSKPVNPELEYEPVKAIRRGRVACGNMDYRRPRVCIAFDALMFEDLQVLAKENNISFGEAVRRAAAAGLERS